jgi:hypothetical protein
MTGARFTLLIDVPDRETWGRIPAEWRDSCCPPTFPDVLKINLPRRKESIQQVCEVSRDNRIEITFYESWG